MGTANFQTDCILKVNGLRSNPTTFRTIAGGTKLRFDVLGGFLGSAQFQFTGVKLESIGLLTSSSWDVGFPYLTYFRDVTFDGNCAGYTVATGLYGGSSKVELTRTSFKGGASNPTFYVVNSHSGARVDLDTVIFDGAAPTFVSVPVSFTRVYLRTVPTWSSTTTALAWEDVVIEKVAEAEMYFPINPAARFGPTYWLATLGSGYNYHFVSPNAGSDVRTWTIRNWIFDTGRYTSGDADGITNPIGGVGSILDVEGCIVLAGPSANTTLVTMAGSSDGVKLRGRRNTYFCNGFGQSAMQFAEASNGVAGQIDEWRSNLAWGTSSDKAFHMWAYAPTPPSTAVAGIVNSTLVTHNAHWNPLLAGVYALSGPSAGNMPSGTNDRVLTANPFLDSTRDAAKWAYTLGLAETPAAAIDAIKKINDFTGQVPGATFRALFDYVTAGFQPVGTAASTLRTAGHDGSYIGAVEPAAGAGEAPSITLSQTTASRTIVQGASSFTPVSINITNGGTGTLDGLSVGESGDAGGGAKGVLGSTTGPTTLTVDQDSGLAALVPGTYTITYTVSSTAAGLTGGSKSFVLTLIVQTAPTGGSGPKTYSGRVKNSVGSVIPGIPFAIVSNSNPTVVTASLANSVDVTFTPLAVGTATVVVQAGGLQRSYAVTVTAA